MILRKLRLSALIVSLALLLSACVEVKGDVSVNSAARFTGEIIYSLDKSLASAAGVASLADLNSVSGTSEELGFCKDVPFTEDSTNYVIKCALKDTVSESGDITASIVGSNIVFRYQANLDATSDQADFGSVSLTVRFLDPVTSIKENKAGLVKKVDNLTYRISGYATELMDIEITANCSSRCGNTNPETTSELKEKLTEEVKSVAEKIRPESNELGNKSAAELTEEVRAIAEKLRPASNEADAKAAADLKAKQEADARAAADKAAADKVAADLKAAAELKAKQEAAVKAAAELKAAADKAAAELKAATDKAAADLKAKLEAEAKAATAKALADKAAAEKLLADTKAAAAKILADAKAKAAAATKKTTITCVKGKLTKKVTAVKPVCPKGYTKKKS